MRVASIHHAHVVLLRAVWLALAASFTLTLATGFAVAQAFSGETTPQPIRQTNTTKLKVNGMGSQAPNESGSALQGAGGVQQSGQSSEGLQNPGSGLNSLQPNAGQSTFNGGN